MDLTSAISNDLEFRPALRLYARYRLDYDPSLPGAEMLPYGRNALFCIQQLTSLIAARYQLSHTVAEALAIECAERAVAKYPSAWLRRTVVLPKEG